MFSIIVPVHNKLPHLDRSINSVLNQSYSNFELILIDDASSDGSESKIYEYQDDRIRCYKRDIPGPGGYAGRNLGIEVARFDWIAFLDADDEWHEDYLLERVAALELYETADIISSLYSQQIHTGARVVNKVKDCSETYTEFGLNNYLENAGLMWTGSVTIKKKLLLDVGMFPDGKCKRGGDLDTWIRCLYNSNQSVFINRSLSIYYRDTVNQVTDHSKNPSVAFCAADTLNLIRAESNDQRLLDAIDVFIATHVYNILRRTKKIRSDDKQNLINLIQSKFLRVKLLLRIGLINVLLKMKLK